MGFGIQKKGKPQQQGGKIVGKGTGTSDDIKKIVPSGSYIMPADSTKQIGAENLEEMGESKEKDRAETVEGMGEPRDVNLSNGEFQFTPDQVHQVGVQALDQMKSQTHTPVDQPKIQGGFGIHKKPELFFANGGVVSPYPNADDIRKAAAQKQIGGPQMRDVTPVQRQLPATTATTNIPNTSAPSTAAAEGGGFVGGLKNVAKGLGKFHGVGSMIGGAVDGFNTDTEQYRQRFGMQTDNPSFLGDLGVRTLGVLSDVGNTATFGLAGRNFADKQQAAAEQNLASQQARFATHNASKATQPVSTPSVPTQPKQLSFNDQVNNELYGTESTAQPAQAASKNSDPYAIQQKGNSFSYTNPAAANQARAAGVPELQTSGFAGGIRRTNDPNGVRNFMANTHEMGPTQEQINQALNQTLNNQQQGFGIRYPDRPQRTDTQQAERDQLVRDLRAPIAGARGMTSSQRAQLSELQTGDDNRATTMYNTDANNATSQANTASNNAASIAQTMMREQGANDRNALSEYGQTYRQGQALDQDTAKFSADFGLKKRQQTLNETKEGFGIRNAQRIEKLQEMYDKAETNEQRQSIQERISRLTGGKENARDRYMTVGGGQEWSEQAGGMVNRPQQIFDTQTRNYVDLGSPAGQQASVGATPDKFQGYQVYTDANGNSAYLDPKTGQFMPIPK